MAKLIKMAIYGEPGVGKSTFASKAPKPFFITTDGNYEYLEDFCGAKPEDHVQVNSWKETVVAFNRDFSDYETIVVDLVEDTYMWAENEFCKDNQIKHISDLGYGKGYGMLANDYFIEYQKLLSLPKNIILILHGVAESLKDRRGIEYTKYGPSKLIREKIITQIEGRIRFFVRAFAETTEDENGRLVTQRYLSLSPDGTTEYGITRGLSGDIPRFIPLDWDVFYELVTKNDPITSSVSTKKVIGTKPEEAAPSVKKPVTKPRKPVSHVPAEEIKPAADVPLPEAESAYKNPIDEIRAKLAAVTSKPENMSQNIPEESAYVEPIVTPATSSETAPATETATVSSEDKMAAIRAKMAALKNHK